MATKDAEQLKKEEKEANKKKLKKAAKSYLVIRQENKKAESAMGVNQNKSKSFLMGYSEVIDTYIDSYGNTAPKDKNIEYLLDDYYRFFPMKKPVRLPNFFLAGGDKKAAAYKDKQEQAEKNQKKQEEALTPSKKRDRHLKFNDGVSEQLSSTLKDTDLLQDEIVDNESDIASKGISSNAMKGLSDISQWLLRNSTKSGAWGDTKTDFVTTYILKQPARVKLFAYYLVETDKRKETNKEAMKESLFESQMDYAPDLEKFKSKMVATKFKFWKRFDAGQFYWDKLAQSMRFAVSNVDSILPFGSLSTREDTGGAQKANEAPAKEGGKEQGKSGQAAGGSGEGKQGQDDKEMQHLELLAKERQMQFDLFMNTGKELIRLKKVREASKPGKALNIDNEILVTAHRLESFYETLEDADKSVGDQFNKVFEGKGLKDMVRFNNVDDNKTTKGGTYSGYAGTVGNLGGTLMLNLDKAAGGWNTFADKAKEWVSWNLHKIPEDKVEGLKNFHLEGNILKIVGPAITLMSVVMNAADVAKHGKTMTAGALTMKGVDMGANALSSLATMTGGIMGLAGVGETAMNASLGAFTAFGGALNMANGITTLVGAGLQKNDLHNANDTIQAREGVSDQEKRRVENMARLGARLASTRQIDATIKTISGGLQLVGGILTATVAGSIAGTVISTVGSLLSLSTYVINYVRKKKNITQTIDEYINMKKMMEIVYSHLSSSMPQDEEFVKNEDKIRNQLRTEAIARLGYPSKESMYNAIIYEYATSIYNHIFFKDGDTSKPIEDEKDMDQAYVQLLSGFGLKPNFGKKQPKISNIAKSLRNV